MRPWWHHPRAQRAVADALFRTWQWAGRIGTLGPDTRVGRRFGAMGTGSALIFPPGPTFGERWVRIGDGTLVGPNVGIAVGMVADEPGFAPPEGRDWVVRIGDRCNIGRGSSIVGRHTIDIGDDVTTGPNVYITDHNHRFDDPDVPIARQWVTEAPVRIGAGSWLGAGVVVLPGARIGRNVVVGASSVVRGELPDGCVAVGAPARPVGGAVDNS
jgi:acetyltransferase-like isoleucine patch superfamily enzyme